jgi:hypothetical protein
VVIADIGTALRGRRQTSAPVPVNTAISRSCDSGTPTSASMMFAGAVTIACQASVARLVYRRARTQSYPRQWH